MTRPHICTRGLKLREDFCSRADFLCSAWPDRIYAQGDWNNISSEDEQLRTFLFIWPDRIYAQGDWNNLKNALITIKATATWPDRIYAQGDWNKKWNLVIIYINNDPTAYMHKGIETSLCFSNEFHMDSFYYDPTAYMHKGIETFAAWDFIWASVRMTRPHICTRGLKQKKFDIHNESPWYDPTAYMHKGIETIVLFPMIILRV